jgi:spore coat protein U-like protein
MPVTGGRSLGLALGCLISLQPAPAQASGNVSCSISATGLVFGQYVPSRNGTSDLTATVQVTCTSSGEAPVAVQGSISLIGARANGRRELADGAHRLGYQLFLDPARTIPWGDGSGESRTQSISGVAAGATPFRATVTVYGRILARQAGAAVGCYSDQISVVLNY